MRASVPDRDAVVICLADRRRVVPGLTVSDRLALNRWTGDGRFVAFGSGEQGTFALLHDRSPSWSSWGILRNGAELLLWDSVSMRDVGRFARVDDALAALPHAPSAAVTHAVSNVVSMRQRIQA